MCVGFAASVGRGPIMGESRTLPTPRGETTMAAGASVASPVRRDGKTFQMIRWLWSDRSMYRAASLVHATATIPAMPPATWPEKAATIGFCSICRQLAGPAPTGHFWALGIRGGHCGARNVTKRHLSTTLACVFLVSAITIRSKVGHAVTVAALSVHLLESMKPQDVSIFRIANLLRYLTALPSLCFGMVLALGISWFGYKWGRLGAALSVVTVLTYLVGPLLPMRCFRWRVVRYALAICCCAAMWWSESLHATDLDIGAEICFRLWAAVPMLAVLSSIVLYSQGGARIGEAPIGDVAVQFTKPRETTTNE